MNCFITQDFTRGFRNEFNEVAENQRLGVKNDSIGNHYPIGFDNFGFQNDSIALNIEHLWEEHQPYLVLAHVFLTIFLVLSNSAVILGLIKTCREIKIPQKLFMASSLCGLFVGMFEPVLFLTDMLPSDTCMIRKIFGMVYVWILMCESEFTITLSITRLISVKWPFFEIEWKSMRKIIIAEIVFALLVPVGLFLLRQDEFLSWVLQGVLSFLCLVMMLTLASLSVYCVLSRSRDTGLRANMAASRVNYNRIWKPVIRIATIQIAYVLCNLPLAVYSFVLILSDPADHEMITSEAIIKNKIITLWLYTLMDFYNGLNACLYMAQSVEIRSYYHRLLTCGLCGMEPNQQFPAVIGNNVKSTATASSSGKSKHESVSGKTINVPLEAEASPKAENVENSNVEEPPSDVNEV